MLPAHRSVFCGEAEIMTGVINLLNSHRVHTSEKVLGLCENCKDMYKVRENLGSSAKVAISDNSTDTDRFVK